MYLTTNCSWLLGHGCVLCFLEIWVYGRGLGDAHTLCKWMSLFGCVLVWCPVFLCALPRHIGRSHSLLESEASSGWNLVSVFLDSWVDGRAGAHTLCKWKSYHVCRSVGVSVFSAAFPHYMGRACKLFGVHLKSGRVCVLCFLGIWLYGKGGEVHTPCVNGCQFSVVSYFGALFFCVPYHDI